MDKRILDGISDAERRLAVAHIIDIVNAVQKQSCPRYSNFLDPAALYFIKTHLRFDADVAVRYCGGYDDAERKMVCVYPDWYADVEGDEPVAVIEASGRMADSLTHRDYLGAVMGLGIKRDTIGDIIVDGSVCYLFCKSEIADYLLNNLDKVGRHGIICRRLPVSDLDLPEKKHEINSVPVISMRLDAILSAALNLSRSKSAELIESGMVNVNYAECNNTSQMLTTGDLVSVRRFGRFQIGEATGMSKKGRTYLEIVRPV